MLGTEGVTHVAPAIRRLGQFTDGGRSPAVIGLIWDPFGDKTRPAPIKDIERKAGKLPVPAGYPATYPAVWLNDTAGISTSGVIAFIDRTGVPLSVIRSDASDAAMRARLNRLH